jgi:phosphoribosyl 1,2-cyclic phosphodiesterase
MICKFWGVRGSLPSPGPETCRYGGNTSCVEIRADGELIILDAGSGLRKLGLALQREAAGRPIRGTILISHTHWDHIHGLPFFAPAFVPGNHFRIYGCAEAPQGLESVFSRQMESPYFPRTLSSLPGTLEFHELAESEMWIGDVCVRSIFMNHPGVTLGFRLEEGNVSVVYATDHEAAEPNGMVLEASPTTPEPALAGAGHQHRKLVQFATGADLLICDAQYTPEEYQEHVHWGHSSTEDALDIALRARARRLALFHHDPERSDRELDRILKQCRKKIAQAGSDMECLAAQEGLAITL